MNKFNKLYEDIFKPASPEEIIERKKIYKQEEVKEWCDRNNVKYNVDNKDNIISFDKNTVNKQDEVGYTALMVSCINNNIEIAKLLLDNGADVNIKNNEGYSVLNYAISHKMKELLKQYGAKE